MTINEEMAEYRAKIEAAIVAGDGNQRYLWEQLALLGMAGGIVDGTMISMSVLPAVTSYDLAETQTAATGTNWTALASGATKNITVRNRTGTNIDIRKVGESVFITLVNGDDVTLPVLANSNEWEIRRSDQSNTQVTIKFLRFA
jgi:hypothetical protein